jgi:ABC-type multidrug transport system fused ATPase/permease subunit
MRLSDASERSEIIATLRSFKRAFYSVALFSAVINLLMLAPALYMLQVYDRVLASSNQMTLAMLTLIMLGLFAWLAGVGAQPSGDPPGDADGYASESAHLWRGFRNQSEKRQSLRWPGAQ